MLEKELYVIAHNIRSAHNVGAIFRSSDGAGVKKIYLTGYSPYPAYLDKKESIEMNKAEKMLAKTALGAERSVSWEKADDVFKLIDELRGRGVSIIALEKTGKSTLMKDFVFRFPVALILGNEVSGVEQAVLDRCDGEIEIPMRGQKESLNVSVAAGIAIYKILE